MTEQEVPELTSHGHTEAATTYNATQSENNLKIHTIDLPQLKTEEKKVTLRKGWRGRDEVGSQALISGDSRVGRVLSAWRYTLRMRGLSNRQPAIER